jgi:hypothetical protein
MSCLQSHAEGGKQIANPKIIGLIPLSQDPQILMINPQTANPQILTKYCTILFQNSHRSRLFKQFFFLVQIRIRVLRRKSMYLRTWGSFKSTNHKKDWVRKSQIRKIPQLRKGPQPNK